MVLSKKFVVLILLTVIITSGVNISFTFAQSDGHDITSIAERVEQLEAQIVILEAEVAELETNVPSHTHGFPAPDFDSGWFTLEPGTFYQAEHDLGTIDLFVYVIGRFRQDQLAGYEIHHIGYGLLSDSQCEEWGLSWYCNKGAYSLYRQPGEYYFKEIRVMIWKLPLQSGDLVAFALIETWILTLALSIIGSVTSIFALIRFVPAFRVVRSALRGS